MAVYTKTGLVVMGQAPHAAATYVKAGRSIQLRAGHGARALPSAGLYPALTLYPSGTLYPDAGEPPRIVKAGRAASPRTARAVRTAPGAGVYPSPLLYPSPGLYPAEGVAAADIIKTGHGNSPRVARAAQVGVLVKAGRGTSPRVGRATDAAINVERAGGVQARAGRGFSSVGLFVKTGRGVTGRAAQGAPWISRAVVVRLRVAGLDLSRYVVSVDKVAIEYERRDLTPWGVGVRREVPGLRSGSFAVKLRLDGTVGPPLKAALAQPPVYVEITHPSFATFSGYGVAKAIASAGDVADMVGEPLDLELDATEDISWTPT